MIKINTLRQKARQLKGKTYLEYHAQWGDIEGLIIIFLKEHNFNNMIEYLENNNIHYIVKEEYNEYLRKIYRRKYACRLCIPVLRDNIKL